MALPKEIVTDITDILTGNLFKTSNHLEPSEGRSHVLLAGLEFIPRGVATKVRFRAVCGVQTQ